MDRDEASGQQSEPDSGPELRPRKRLIAKAAMACDRCRLKKIKCDGNRPCRSCLNRRVDCLFAAAQNPRPRRSAKERVQQLQQQLDRANHLLRASGIAEEPPSPSHSQHRSPHSQSSVEREDACRVDAVVPVTFTTPAISDINYARPIENGNASNLALDNNQTGKNKPASRYNTFSEQARPHLHIGTSTEPVPVQFPFSPCSASTRPSAAFDPVQHDPAHLLDERNEIRNIEQSASRDEIHGPASYLSPCFDPGLSWIADQVGDSNYQRNASSMISAINQALKLKRRIDKTRAPDPSPELASIYTESFFERTLEGSFYIIDRPGFEDRLKKHYENLPANDDEQEEDCAWYALRNIVYASGCRNVAYGSCTWIDAQSQSVKYFENALSVETDLIHREHGLAPIQALLCMALFAEGVGGQKLEFMLVGCALRVAQARGLHLRSSNPATTQADDERRHWLFWSIYCFEKHLALRSGRPSAIDDDEIDCELPTIAPGGNSNILAFMRCTIQHAQISSAILKGLMTTKARRQPLQRIAKIVHQYDQQLRTWYANVPFAFKTRIGGDLRGQTPLGLHVNHLMYIELSYHGVLAIVHCIIGHPWNISSPSDQTDTVLQDQISLSNNRMAEASRSIILLSRSIVIDSTAPAWLVFYFPMIGMMNLFINVLKNPLAESSIKDIGLLDLAAGYFGYLEYATDSAVAFPFVRDVVNLARLASTRAKIPSSETDQRGSSALGTGTSVPELPLQSNVHSNHGYTLQPSVNLDSWYNADTFAFNETNFADWPLFLPRLPQI